MRHETGRLGLRYGITFENFSDFQRSPGVWDPLVGVMWRNQGSKKWTLSVKAQGGGFAAGTDEEWLAVGKADWQFAKHFGLMFGFGDFHFKISNRVLGKTLTVNQTLYGPQFGFGIYF